MKYPIISYSYYIIKPSPIPSRGFVLEMDSSFGAIYAAADSVSRMILRKTTTVVAHDSARTNNTLW